MLPLSFRQDNLNANGWHQWWDPYRTAGLQKQNTDLRRACDVYEGQQRTLLQENARLVETTMKLAAVIDQLIKDVSATEEPQYSVSSLVLDLQRCQKENAHLTEVLHKQRGTMECQAHQIAVLSNQISEYQAIIAQKTSKSIGNSQTPASSNGYRQRG